MNTVNASALEDFQRVLRHLRFQKVTMVASFHVDRARNKEANLLSRPAQHRLAREYLQDRRQPLCNGRPRRLCKRRGPSNPAGSVSV